MRFSPDGKSLYQPFTDRGFLYQNATDVSRTWDTRLGQPTSPILEGTTYPTYTPAGDRVLTYTNNVWQLRRAARRPSARGSAVFHRGRWSRRPDASGRSHGHRSRDLTAPLRLWQISPEAEPLADGRAGNQPTTAESAPTGPAGAGVELSGHGFCGRMGEIAITLPEVRSGEEAIRVSDLATGRPLGRPCFALSRLERPCGSPSAPTADRFATGSNPEAATAGEVRLWDASTGRLRLPPLPHTNYVAALAFQPDGKVLAAGDYNGLVRLWDTSTGQEIGRPLPQGEIVLSLAYSPDGKMLAVGLANDHTGKPGIRLWDTGTRRTASVNYCPARNRSSESNSGRMGGPCSRCTITHTRLWDTTPRAGDRRADASTRRPAGFVPTVVRFLTLGRTAPSSSAMPRPETFWPG